MAYEITLNRYYDRFKDQPQFSDYKVLLFRAGDALQSAELNELQTTLHQENTNIAANFLLNGSIVSGGNVEIDRTSAGTNPDGDEIYNLDVNLNETIVFLNTHYISVPGSVLQLVNQYLPSQDNNIGVKITYSEVSVIDDASLKDPAVETRNYRQPGAGRLKITGEWIFEDDFIEEVGTEFIPLFQIVHGELVSLEGQSQFDKNVINIIAKYDRNSNGNYVIDGYEVSYLEKSDDLGPFTLSVAEGNANVYGYNYETEISQELEIAPLIDFELKQSEPNDFGAIGIIDNFYPTRHFPVRKVFRISGQKQMGTIFTDNSTNDYEEVTHGGFAGASDELQNQPVISLIDVRQDGKSFVEGTDYQLSGDSIAWIGGVEPDPSSTYFVSYRYNFTETADVNDGTFPTVGGEISADKKSIKLLGFAQGTTVNVDYDFTLQRYDAVFLDANGKLNSTKGVPDENDPRVPGLDKDYTLKVAEVLLGADFDPSVTQASLRVFKMSDIQLLLDNIKQNEYNITRLALATNMKENQPTSTFVGQFVDDFADDDMRDDGYSGLNQNAMSIGGNLILDIDWATVQASAVLPSEQLTIEIPSTQNGVVLDQPFSTKTRQINQYIFKSAPEAKINIHPKVYRWVTKTSYSSFVHSAQTATRGINSWTTRYKEFGTHRYHSVVKYSTTTSSVSREVLGRSVSRSTSISTSRTPAIIPRINIQVSSEDRDFNSNEQVGIYFADKLVGNTTASSTGQVVNASFQIPENVYSGTKEVRLTGADSQVEGKTIFQATPLSRRVQTTVTNWWRWVVRRQGTVWREADPVAQSFVLDETTAIDGINVYFETLPVTATSCVICETTAGLPDKTKALVSATLEPQDLNNTGATFFAMPNKIVLTKGKEYAFIVICKDAVGTVKVARLGERDDDVGKWITNQAYSVGVLFSSSNNSAWTPIQEEDMKFQIISCRFDPTYEYVFPDANVVNATDLMILANAKVEEGTTIQYKVNLLDRTENNEFYINGYSQFPLETIYSGAVRVTALFESLSGVVTPVLDPEMQIAVGTSSHISDYVSRAFEFDADASIVDVYLDNYKPSNTNVAVFYQKQDVADGPLEWVEIPIVHSKPLGNDWIETHFRLEGISAPQNLHTRVRLVLETSNDKDRPAVSNLRFNVQKI